MDRNRKIYLGIGLFGFMYSLLTYSNYGEASGLTSMFLFSLLLLGIKLIQEYRYYSSYRAPLASGIFLLIPSFLFLIASFVSRIASINGNAFLQDRIINLDLNFSLLGVQEINLFINVFSIFFSLPFFAIVTLLLYRYYYGIYPRLFILRRKFFKQFAMYYNLGLIVIVWAIWGYFGNILIIELTFVVLSLVFIIQSYVLKIVLVPVRVTHINRREKPKPKVNSRRRNVTDPILTPNNTRNQHRPIPQLRTRNNVRSTVVRPNYVPNNRTTMNPNRNTSNTSYRQNSNQIRPINGSSTNSNIEIVQGASIVPQHPKNGNSITRKSIKEYLPTAKNLTKDDFRCIFCYDLPVKANDNVIICPNCKKPAHQSEYRQWKRHSPICSYCNKDVGSRSPRQISGRNYSKVVSMALKIA